MVASSCGRAILVSRTKAVSGCSEVLPAVVAGLGTGVSSLCVHNSPSNPKRERRVPSAELTTYYSTKSKYCLFLLTSSSAKKKISSFSPVQLSLLTVFRVLVLFASAIFSLFLFF